MKMSEVRAIVTGGASGWGKRLSEELWSKGERLRYLICQWNAVMLSSKNLGNKQFYQNRCNE